MSISRESREQTEQRLREVIAAAEFVTLDGAWAFREGPLGQPPELTEQLLAVVRDETSWSWLTTATPDDQERFAVFSFHFPSGLAQPQPRWGSGSAWPLYDSGFVGWLASALKQELGTGVFVVCGHNSRRGGIYDYWGCPAQLRDNAARVIHQLRDDR